MSTLWLIAIGFCIGQFVAHAAFGPRRLRKLDDHWDSKVQEEFEKAMRSGRRAVSALRNMPKGGYVGQLPRIKPAVQRGRRMRGISYADAARRMALIIRLSQEATPTSAEFRVLLRTEQRFDDTYDVDGIAKRLDRAVQRGAKQ